MSFRSYDQFTGQRDHYDTAQVCLKGHEINQYAQTQPEHNQKYCSKCGAETITACPECKHAIRGYFHVEGVLSLSSYRAPSFCYNCGKPYPWMQERLQTAKDLLYHDDKLSLADREKLWDLLQYVMSDPKADLAPAKKKLFEIGIAKALPATREFLLDLLAKFMVEAAKP